MTAAWNVQRSTTGSVDDVDDRELVRRVHEGDSRALEDLVRRYRPMALRKSRSRFLEGHDRDDLFQEAMLGVWKAIRGFDLEMSTPFYAFADLCVDRQLCTVIKAGLRNKHRPLNSRDSLDTCDPSRGGSRAEHLAGPATDDPTQRAISAEEVEMLKGAFFQTLSPLERRVLSLFVDGRSYDEIASATGGSIKSIDNALQRVRKKLRSYMSARSSDELEDGYVYLRGHGRPCRRARRPLVPGARAERAAC